MAKKDQKGVSPVNNNVPQNDKVAVEAAEMTVALETLALVEDVAAAPEVASPEEQAALYECGETYAKDVKLCREYVIEDNDQVHILPSLASVLASSPRFIL
jgi:hypothetical protein